MKKGLIKSITAFLQKIVGVLYREADKRADSVVLAIEWLQGVLEGNEEKAKEANKKIQIRVVEKVKIIKENSNANKTAITQYVTDTCELSNAAVLLHDSASQNELPPSTISSVRGTSKFKVPELLTTVTDNYGSCYETREKLKAWQDWYRTQKQIFGDVK
jgi:hypothetical protein